MSSERIPEPPPSRDVHRSRRKREVRARTENLARMPKRTLALLHVPYPEGVERPRTRGDCANVPRPCPWVSCAHNLYLDALGTGNLKFNFPDIEPDQMPAGGSCALDVADEGGATLERTGVLLNMTRERVRQIEAKAQKRLLHRRDMSSMRALAELATHDRPQQGGLAGVISDGGGGGGSAGDADETTTSHTGDRAKDVDPDELFCARVNAAYELALVRREKGWERPEPVLVPEPPPLDAAAEGRIAAALTAAYLDDEELLAPTEEDLRIGGEVADDLEPLTTTELDALRARDEAPPPPPAAAPAPRRADARRPTTAPPPSGPTTRKDRMTLTPPQKKALAWIREWYGAHEERFEMEALRRALGCPTVGAAKQVVVTLKKAGALVGSRGDLRLADAPAAVPRAAKATPPAKPRAAKRKSAPRSAPEARTFAGKGDRLAIELRARRDRLARELAAVDTLLEALAS